MEYYNYNIIRLFYLPTLKNMRFAYSPNKLNEWNIRLSRPIFDQGKANSKS